MAVARRGRLGGEAYGLPEMPMMAQEMLGLALAYVDWHGMARDYIEEEQD